MTISKIIRIAAFAMMITIALPVYSASVINALPASNSLPAGEDPRAAALLFRLDEIQKMNRSDMTRLEKKAIRKEVKEIKKEIKAIKGGVYLSVGAIIIIILLLILIL